MAAICLLAAPLLLAAAQWTEPMLRPASQLGCIHLAGLALLGQLAGQVCLAKASRRLGAVGMSTIILAEPPMVGLFAVLLLGAPLHPPQTLGPIAIGMWFCQTRQSRTICSVTLPTFSASLRMPPS